MPGHIPGREVPLHKQLAVIGLGVQKAGTTWLAVQLRKHPDVFVSNEFALLAASVPETTSTSWKHTFRAWKGERIVGTYHNEYFYSPITRALVRERLSAAKLYVVLRDPIRRAVSNYFECVRDGQVKKGEPFERAIVHPSIMYQCIYRGFYDQYLEGWLEWVDRSQLKVLLYEDMVNDPAAYLRSVGEFIGVSAEGFDMSALGVKVHSRGMPRSMVIEQFVRTRLPRITQTLERVPALRTCARLTGFSSARIGNAINRLNDRPSPSHHVENTMREMFSHHFNNTRTYVGEFLGRDLDTLWPL